MVVSMERGEDIGADWMVSSMPVLGVLTATWVTVTISPIGSSAVTGKYLVFAPPKRDWALTAPRLKIYTTSAGEGFPGPSRGLDGGQVLTKSLRIDLGDLVQRTEVD